MRWGQCERIGEGYGQALERHILLYVPCEYSFYFRNLARTETIGFWMSDKPLVQQALATDLANILLLIPSQDAAFNFLKGFWQALVREWAGIDRLR